VGGSDAPRHAIDQNQHLGSGLPLIALELDPINTAGDRNWAHTALFACALPNLDRLT